MGGFPGPVQLFQSALRVTAPKLGLKLNKLERKVTMMPSIRTLESRNVPWLKRLDTLEVWRNSDFRTETLSDEELADIGGAEYKALRLLSYLVPAVSIFCLYSSYARLFIVKIVLFLLATVLRSSVFTMVNGQQTI